MAKKITEPAAQGKAALRPGLPPELWLIMGLGVLAQLALAGLTKGYPYDTSCFFAWGQRMVDVGPAGFYAPDFFADYPPAYMLVLGGVTRLMQLLGLNYTQSASQMLLVLVPAACSAALGAVVYHIARENGSEKMALRLAACAVFCPVFLYDTAIWKQVDLVSCLLLVLCFWMLQKEHWLAGALAYGLSLAVKPQALLVGPVLALCFLRPLLADHTRAGLMRTGKNILAGVALGLTPTLLCALPFNGQQTAGWLLEKYFGTATSYQYATIDAANWFAALGGNWAGWDEIFLCLKWREWGVLNLVLLSAFTLWLAWRSAKENRFCPLLLAGFYQMGIYTLAHCMHERYMLVGVALLLAAAARRQSRNLLLLAGGFSVVGFVNLAMVYTTVDTDDQFLNSATSQLLLRGMGLVETVLFAGLALLVYRLLIKGEQPARLAAPEVTALAAVPAPQPRWTRREALALAALTVGTAVVSLLYLGDTTAPENLFDATGTTRTVTVQAENAATVWVYPGVSMYGSLTIADETGTEMYNTELSYGNPFTWQVKALADENDTPESPGVHTYTITVNNAAVVEMAFLDAEGGHLAVSGEGAELFDEQALVPQTISQLNSAYFDEIYHGRTAYEYIHKLSIYETTHPPLGKVFIMLGILLFGMTGFGWRVAGALFGVAMVPVVYLLARRLFRKPWLAGVAAALFALDFMRFAQSRIATIDVYGTFFILLGALMMVWYCQSVLQKGVCKSLLPMALAGVAFGLGAASKWTGIYAGAAWAILYFGVLWARGQQKPAEYKKEVLTALVGGVICFVLVPLVLYMASYFPYWMQNHSFGLKDWWDCQTFMFGYHKNLEATHPFESRWYTWPFGLRPVWYYGNYNLPDGQSASIAGMGNPLLWLAYFAAVIGLCGRQLTGHGDRTGGALLVMYFVQLAPWMMVARCTFLYHYFPSVGFALLALVWWLNRLDEKEPKKAKRAALVCVGVAAVLFIAFYPALSGLPVASGYAKVLQQCLPSWGFYSV